MPDNQNSQTEQDEAAAGSNASNLRDYVSSAFFGFDSYKDAVDHAQGPLVRQFLSDFFYVISNIRTVKSNIENDTLTLAQQSVLDALVSDEGIYTLFLDNYTSYLMKGADADLFKDGTYDLAHEVAKLQDLVVNLYVEYKAKKNEEATYVDPTNYIDEQINKMSEDPNLKFIPYFEHLNAYSKIREKYLPETGLSKFREDTAPEAIQQWQCRIGASTFFIPPTSISVNQVFKAGSINGAGGIRQPNSIKTNLGKSETVITMTLYFPNHETIWGFDGNTAPFDIFNWDPDPIKNEARDAIFGQSRRGGSLVEDKVVDKYLSSLRGLITQFKYSPFLPIRNTYLNRTFGVTAVTMNNMTVSTVENYPFVLAVQLEMNKFNFKPYLPMLDDFDQAIHWGKYRQYMGRAAARLDSKVNQGFLIEKNTQPTYGSADTVEHQLETRQPNNVYFEGDLLPRFDKAADIRDGRYFDLYYPVTTPSRIFAPDTTDFRQPNEDNTITEDYWDFFLTDLGFNIVDKPEFNFFEYDRAYLNRAYRNERKVLFDWLETNNITYELMTPGNKATFIDYVIQEGEKTGYINASNEEEIRSMMDREWYFMIFEKLMLMDNPRFQKLIESRAFQDSQYVIKEWNVPMEKLYIDWRYCIIGGISVSLSNNFAKLPIQMHQEPTYQHIGGGDSRIDVKMTIIGEDNLLRFERLFEHISGLARLEKAHGVLGFLGIKNVVTALCGIKYALPLSFEVDTVPNFPHVYQVSLSLIDFDVMQQEREVLSSEQQKDLVERFGKHNPFLRLKQAWGAFNAYPDLPLDIRDEEGKIIGHFDPDWYYRSFTTTNSDDDIFNWGIDNNILQLVTSYSQVRAQLNNASRSDQARDILTARLAELEEAIRSAIEAGAELPMGYDWGNNTLIELDSYDLDPNNESFPEPEHIQYLGNFDEDGKTISFIAFYKKGFFTLGTENVDTNEREYNLKIAFFDEDNPNKNLQGVNSIPGLTPYSEYQNEYIDNGTNPNKQYESMLQDFQYRSLRGRMVKAFPTYMLWLIDEGGRFAGIKLFDNFYGLNSVIDFSTYSSEEHLSDTLVLRVSNIYNKLTTPYKDLVITEDDPLWDTPIGNLITTFQNRTRNMIQGLTDEILELNSIRLKPGVRVHLRAGYGSNPSALQTIFNGVIAEVQQGDIMTVVCQSDAVELTGMVNGTNPTGHSGKLDGGIDTGFWLSEPRDLMVRLLSMGSSNFKEWVAMGSRGVIFSESRFGIRHFGNILYQSMNQEEENGHSARRRSIIGSLFSNDPNYSSNDIRGFLGNYGTQLSEMDSFMDLPGTVFNSDLIQIGKALWLNGVSKRDYEVFKRNIYPGNGTGIAQFMGGDMIDGGVAITTSTAFIDKTVSASTTNINPNDITEQEQQKKDIISVWDSIYSNEDNLPADELMDLIAEGNDKYVLPGTLEDMFDGQSGGNMAVNLIKASIGNETLVRWISNPLLAASFEVGARVTGIDFLRKIPSILGPMGMASGMVKLYRSPLGQILGLRSMVPDDDLDGYDEVSFRAQTYMKTVWDLFRVCANLLPNYIVSIRPFEDRSTIFYGKPHWLYTSGVIPVTLGVGLLDEDGNPTRNRLERPDEALQDIYSSAKKVLGGGYERLFRLTDESGLLKDIMNFTASDDIDPYVTQQPSSTSDNTSITDTELDDFFDNQANFNLLDDNDEFKDDIISSSRKAFKKYAGNKIAESDLKLFIWVISVWQKYDKSTANDTGNGLTSADTFPNAINPIDIYNDEYGALLSGNENLEKTIEDTPDSTDKFFDRMVKRYVNQIGSKRNKIDVKELFWTDRHDDTNTKNMINSLLDSLSSDKEVQQKMLDLLDRDPVAFSYQFGWKFSTVPVWIDPISGYGDDKVGNLARALYNEKASDEVDALNNDINDEEAKDIWGDFREQFPFYRGTVDLYKRILPFDLPDGEESQDTEANSHYYQVMDLFMRFLWQDPYNRAWVVITADRERDSTHSSLSELVNPITSPLNPFANIYRAFSFSFGDPFDTDRDWNFEHVIPVWEKFLLDDVKINGDNSIEAPNTRAYMEANQKAGNSADTALGGIIEGVDGWFDENIGQLVSMIHDTMVGFVQSIRLSLIQTSTALSIANESQKQASILNSSLDDSIYYKLGTSGSLLRMVDNPFTREYGEPVVEIREPFQRIHFVSSWDSIIDNGITESLDNVTTVVTAVSDGKHPVTVHFDKGIPPDRQIEKVVETGIYWDNAVGNGLLGMFHPLIHPLETLRSYAKSAAGSSDQLTSRRIALAHLKESLKDIYTGEITLLGSPDIRPYDLLYIADVSERMYGLVEVEQVTHHFTPETGFVTTIVPNALVTANDPVRWSLLSFVWSKMNSYNMRDDVRAVLNVRADRELALASKEITSDDVYKYFSTQLQGSTQYTQGNTALVRDISAMFSAGGVRELRENEENSARAIGKIDLSLALMQGGATAGGAVIGTLVSPGYGTVVGGVGGWAVSDLMWKAWDWVKNNLLDQHGCYIQFLNKDGQPMDAGLSYYQGVAVGSNHTISLFPNSLGIPGPAATYKENDHYRITTDDLLGALGWTEVETVSLFRETSMYVNEINKNILIAANRDFTPIEVTNDNSWVFTAVIKDADENGIEDGDTLNVTVLDSGNSPFKAGQDQRIRLAVVNTYELEHHDNPNTDVDESNAFNSTTDLGKLAQDYLRIRFFNKNSWERTVAIRVDRRRPQDDYGRLIGLVYHNVQLGISASQRGKVLMEQAKSNPPIPFDAYLEDGRPYTLNWEMVMTGYGNVYMQESIFDTTWRNDAIDYGG